VIAIVDYGMGNIRSVMNALAFLGAESELTANPARILDAERVVLPGVGAFNAAMQRLRQLELVPVLREAVLERCIPLLGVCLGMQLLAEAGEENGETEGVGLIPGRVRHIHHKAPGRKVPHIGFNSLAFRRQSPLFAGLSERGDFYFVHSFCLDCPPEYVTSVAEYEGAELTATVERGLVFGVQFHPEKSQGNGLRLLRNFLDVPA